MESIKTLIEGNSYKTLLENVRKEINIRVNEANLPSALLNVDVNRLRAAKLDAQALENILGTDMNEITRYVVSRIGTVKDDGEQEYPEGEEPDEDDEDEVIETLPYYKNFLVGFIIEYCLLKQKPSELPAYLKALRIPGAKKFEKELKDIYSSI
jgi:hypothetical protein